MQLLDQNLKLLVMKKMVTFEDALAKASNPSEFERAVGAILRSG